MYIYNHGNYMISCDWLQAFCSGGIVESGEYVSDLGCLRVELQEGGTTNFARRSLIYWNNTEIATLLQSPKMATLDRLLTELKLHNRVLYTASPCRILLAICEAINIEYRGVSRLDLCCDCNTLSGGASVEQLIHDFVILQSGDYDHVVRRGSAKYILHGNNHRKAAIRFESIKFGSPLADVVPYIYNKSIELIEVKDKPWIREAWKNAGLVHIVDHDGLQRLSPSELSAKIADSGVSEFIRQGVWRFEISIKSHGKDLLSLASGELFKLGLDSISTAEKLEELFQAYASKYFDFRRSFGRKRVRDYKPIQLWEFKQKCDYRPYSPSVNGETGRFEQSVVNYLNKMMRTYSDLSSSTAASICEARDTIQCIAGAKAYLVRKKRFESYLDSLLGHQYFEGLQREAAFASFEMSRDKKEFREMLPPIDWGHYDGVKPRSLRTKDMKKHPAERRND